MIIRLKHFEEVAIINIYIAYSWSTKTIFLSPCENNASASQNAVSRLFFMYLLGEAYRGV